MSDTNEINNRLLVVIEKNLLDQVGQIRDQVQAFGPLPTEMGKLVTSMTYQERELTRTTGLQESQALFTRSEFINVRERIDAAQTYSHSQNDVLSKAISSAADRIENKFNDKIASLNKVVIDHIADYSKKIVAVKAVTQVAVAAFFLFQGVVGVVASSYVNGWKTKIEDNEIKVLKLEKQLKDNELLIKEIQQELLSRGKQ